MHLTIHIRGILAEPIPPPRLRSFDCSSFFQLKGIFWFSPVDEARVARIKIWQDSRNTERGLLRNVARAGDLDRFNWSQSFSFSHHRAPFACANTLHAAARWKCSRKVSCCRRRRRPRHRRRTMQCEHVANRVVSKNVDHRVIKWSFLRQLIKRTRVKETEHEREITRERANL